MKLDRNTGIIYEHQMDKEERALFRENLYFIKYNSEKASYAFERIWIKTKNLEQHDIFLCHIYLDLFLEALGQLYARFFPGNSASEKIKLRAKETRWQYRINDQSELFLARGFRNFATHIDERNLPLIEADNYRGTFNILYEGIDDELRANLTTKNTNLVNILDLEEKMYLIWDKGRKSTLNLDKCKKEVDEIFRVSSILWEEFMKPKWPL